MKKYFAFSDTHGCFTELQTALAKAGFEKDNVNHILIGVGDYFDRGSENKEMLEFLYDMFKKGRLQHILGNHDEMLLDFITGKDDGMFNAMNNGMDKTIANFSGFRLDVILYRMQYQDLVIEKIKENHPYLLEFLKAAKHEINIGKYKFTHAGYTHVNKYSPWELPTRWEVDNWSNTPYWIDSFKNGDKFDPLTTYVFGHWHATLLHDDFIGAEFNEFGRKKKHHTTFVFENFIGLDACTNLSGFVNILTFEGE